MPDSTREQIIATNNQRRATADAKQDANTAQYGRNLAMIQARNRAAAKASPRSNAADRSLIQYANGPKQITAKAPRDRAAEAAGVMARPVVPVIGGGGDPAGGFVPPRLQAAMGNAGITPEAHQQHTPENSPGLAGQPTAAILPTEAEMSAQARPSLDAIPGDAAAIQAAAPPAAQMIDDGTDEIVQRAKILAAAARNGQTPQQAQAMGEAAAITAKAPATLQAAGDRAAVSAMRPTNFRSAAPTTAPAPGVDPRYDALAYEAQRGQAAIDAGGSLEADKAANDLAATRAHEVAVTAAGNPPRQVGATSSTKITVREDVLAAAAKAGMDTDGLKKLGDYLNSNADADGNVGGAVSAANPMTNGSQTNPAKPQDQATFDKLPSGAWFVNPADGKLLQKK